MPRFSLLDHQATSLRHGPGKAIAAKKVKAKAGKVRNPKGKGLVAAAKKADSVKSLVEVTPPAEMPFKPQPVYLSECDKAARSSAKAIMARMLQEGISPLEVMVENMRFAHSHATRMFHEIVGEMPSKVMYEDGREDLFDKFQTMMKAREMAQQCARDAAPYIHPKLQSIEVKDGDRQRPTLVRRIIVDVAAGTATDGDAGTGSGLSCAEEDDSIT